MRVLFAVIAGVLLFIVPLTIIASIFPNMSGLLSIIVFFGLLFLSVNIAGKIAKTKKSKEEKKE